MFIVIIGIVTTQLSTCRSHVHNRLRRYRYLVITEIIITELFGYNTDSYK